MSTSRQRRLRAALFFALVPAAIPAMADEACRSRDYGPGYFTQLADQSGACIGLFSEGLAPITLDGREGYIDRDGHLVIEPRFGWARPFVQGRAAADDLQGKTGYIDTHGEWIIAPRFVAAENFNAQGTAVVRLEGYRQALIDRDGKVIRDTGPEIEIEPASSFDPFPAGLAQAKRIRPGFLIHLDGRVLRPAPGVSVTGYDEEAKAFRGLRQIGSDMQSGLLDAQLHWIGEPRFRLLSEFNADSAAASLDGAAWGLIDARGVERTPFRFTRMRVAAPGLWVATDHAGDTLVNGRGKPLASAIRQPLEKPFGDWFVHLPEANTLEMIRADGKTVHQRFDRTIDSVEARGRVLAVQLQDNGEETPWSVELIDRTGRRVLPAAAPSGGKHWQVFPVWAEQVEAGELPLALLQRYGDNGADELGIVTASGLLRMDPAWQEFKEGSSYDARERIVVRTLGGEGAIDGEGEWVVRPTYTQLSSFRQGWARAMRGERYFLVNRDGREIAVPQLGSELPVAGLYVLTDDRGDQAWGPANAYDLDRGRFLFEKGFEEMRPFRDGLAPVRMGRQWGLIDRHGQWRVAPAYSDIEAFGTQFWKARRHDERGWESITSLLSKDGKILLAEPWLTIYSNRDSHSDFWPPEGLPENLVPRTDTLMLDDGVALSTVMVESTSLIGGGWSTVSLKEMEGFVDARGDWAIRPDYQHVDNFPSGRTATRVHDGQRYSLIDAQGKTVFGPVDGLVSEVSADDMFYVHDKRSDRTAIHKLGEGERFQLPGQVYGDFGDGVFSYETGEGEERTSFAYDYGGRLLSEAKGARLSSYAEGLALRQDSKSGRFDYVDKSGARALPGRYLYATVFRDGRAVVMDEQGYRLIDRQGKTLVRVGEACGREVLLDAAGVQTWPKVSGKDCPLASRDTR